MQYLQEKKIILHHCCKIVIIKPTIRAFVAAPLMLIFVFSATPKVFLHNLIANHHDGSYAANGKTPRIAVASFHCDCENLVVQVPYLDNPVLNQDPATKIFQRFQIKKEKPAYPIHYFIFGFRGPPTMS
jgi:hypothetical protein